jgi:hypothetical protein
MGGARLLSFFKHYLQKVLCSSPFAAFIPEGVFGKSKRSDETIRNVDQILVRQPDTSYVTILHHFAICLTTDSPVCNSCWQGILLHSSHQPLGTCIFVRLNNCYCNQDLHTPKFQAVSPRNPSKLRCHPLTHQPRQLFNPTPDFPARFKNARDFQRGELSCRASGFEYVQSLT